MRQIIFVIIIFLMMNCAKDRPTTSERTYIINNLRDDVKQIISDYIDSVNSEKEQKEKYRFFRMVVKESDSQTKFRIYPELYLSSLIKDPPYEYLTLDSNIVIVNSGMERFTNNDTVLNELLKVNKLMLENDLNKDGTVNEDYQYHTFDPITWEIIINGDSITIDKNPPMSIRGIIFLPPKN